MIFLLFPLLLATFLYCCIRQKQCYWSQRKVSSPAEFFFTRSENFAHYTQRIYKQFKHTGERFVGIHLVFQPAAMVVDLDLIRHVIIADFEFFSDRGLYHNSTDDILSGHLVRLEGESWRRLRTKLSPTFTSAKMRYMFGTLVQVAERFTELMTELVQPQATVLEIHDLCARFTTDVIGLVGYGIECNSLREPNSQFRLMGNRAVRTYNPIVEMLCNKFPRLARKCHMKVYSPQLIEFYTRIITQNIEYRERKHLRRNDFLDILLELKNEQQNGKFVLTVKEIIAQSFALLNAGFETSASTMSFTLYELSQNPAIQQCAHEEVLQCLQRHNNQLTYDCMKDMKYLEQIVSETLRKYPVFPGLIRIARNDYVVPQTEQVIEKGIYTIIPVYAIHHDAEYYPNPELFDPARFTPEAIQARHPMAYLPFGAGPRNCIAERFGKMQVMIGLAMLLRYFRFSYCEETPQILNFDVKEPRFLDVANGIKLKVCKI